MRKSSLSKRTLAVVLVLGLLAVLPLSQVRAAPSQTVSFLYIDMTSTAVYVNTTYTYTPTWKVKVTNSLTWNASYAGSISVRLRDPTNGTSMLDLAYFRNGILGIYYATADAGVVLLVSTAWNETGFTTVEYTGTQLVVKNSTNNVLLDVPLTLWSLNSAGILSQNATYAYVANGGYIKAQFTTVVSVSAMDLQVVIDIIPLIVVIAALGMVMRLFKEM